MDALERLYRRFVPPNQVVTPELATTLTEIARDTGRRTAVVISRKGTIEYVVVGTSTALEDLPPLASMAPKSARLSGLRLVQCHLRGEPLDKTDFHRLSVLSLDFLLALDATPARNPLMAHAAWLLPVNPQNRIYETLGPVPLHRMEINFHEHIQDLEDQYSRRSKTVESASKGAERAILVFLDDGRYENPEWELEELKELALSAGLKILETVTQKRRADVTWFVGKGKLLDLVMRAQQLQVDLLVFSPELSPAQVRNIGNFAETRVIDRTQLILDIFAQRARSSDGKHQVELAQLKYLLPRLAGFGAQMARFKGVTGMRGPGETKLELDRRKIRKRITALEGQLELLAARRRERRKLRERSNVPVVSIVGYTNAGKSTLLNTLTHANALAENKLFATLDPFSKRLRFPEDREIILTDTVGFIRDLPKDLLTAFKATLEELETADLLLHVVDGSNPRAEEQLLAVEQLLQDLELAHVPRITVLNKVDRLPDPSAANPLAQRYGALPVSALTRATLRPLVDQLQMWLAQPTLHTQDEEIDEKLRA